MRSFLVRFFVSPAIPLAVLLTLGASARQASAQVFTEDFSGGNPAVSSDYALVNTGVSTTPGQYRIVNNPATAFTNGYVSFFDHTVGTAAGSMLFFDGPSTGRIWFRSTTLTAGTQYNFSYWGASGSAQNVPTLQALINGLNLGPVLTTTSGTWTQASANFTAATSGPFTFAIIDTNQNSGAGNDGAIDDVRLSVVSAAAPEPGSVALLGTGLLGMAGSLLRRRKRDA